MVLLTAQLSKTYLPMHSVPVQLQVSGAMTTAFAICIFYASVFFAFSQLCFLPCPHPHSYILPFPLFLFFSLFLQRLYHLGLESVTLLCNGNSTCRTKEVVQLLSRVRLFATPWTVACQAPSSMGFSRQEYWSGLPFPSPSIGINTIV